MKKVLIALGVAGLVFVGIKNFDLSVYIIFGGIFLIVLYGFFRKPSQEEVEKAKANPPTTSYVSKKTEYKPEPETEQEDVLSFHKHPLTWTHDKQYVMGYGYRDKYGNYYSMHGRPIPTPVVMDEKKK